MMVNSLKALTFAITALGFSGTIALAGEALLDGVRPFICDGDAIVFIEDEDGWTIPTYSTGEVKQTDNGWRIEDTIEGTVMYLREDRDDSWVVDRVSEKGHVKFDCIDVTDSVSQVVTIIKPRLSDTIVETQQALSQATKDLGVVEQNRLQLLADQMVEMNRATGKHNAAMSRAEAEHNAEMSRAEAEHNAEMSRAEAEYNAEMSRVKAGQRVEMSRANADHNAAMSRAMEDQTAEMSRVKQALEQAVQSKEELMGRIDKFKNSASVNLGNYKRLLQAAVLMPSLGGELKKLRDASPSERNNRIGDSSLGSKGLAGEGLVPTCIKLLRDKADLNEACHATLTEFIMLEGWD
ncbi:hypothetical protein N9W76_04910 [Planktomarina temperata]|nr:hypothetical protein [Planktomarina temperata]